MSVIQPNQPPLRRLDISNLKKHLEKITPLIVEDVDYLEKNEDISVDNLIKVTKRQRERGETYSYLISLINSFTQNNILFDQYEEKKKIQQNGKGKIITFD